MAKKTGSDKGDKSEKGSTSTDKHGGDKTPVEPPKNVDEADVGKKLCTLSILLDQLSSIVYRILLRVLCFDFVYKKVIDLLFCIIFTV